jgi:hypothetical protein
MPSKIIQKLIDKGWSEEEINEYLYLAYKDSKDERDIKNKLKRLNLKTDIFLLIISSIVFGLFFMVFSIFQVEFASIPLIILLAGFTEMKMVELFPNSKNSLMKSVGLTSAIITLILIATRIAYSALMHWKKVSPTSPYQLLIILAVGVAVTVLTGLFISLLKKKTKS